MPNRYFSLYLRINANFINQPITTMRHILLTALIILCAGKAFSRQISYSEAYTIGADFIGKKSPSKTIARNNHPDCNTAVSPYYIFNTNDGDGFVIVAGDTRAKSILAYSSTGSLDSADMPPQLVSVLNQYAQQISALSDYPEDDCGGTPTKAEIRSQKILQTALFHQGTPFNLLTPIVDGMHCVTGCVATAMAIIMKYHNWPDKEMGYVYFDYNMNLTSYDFNAEFDWDNILNDYSGATTEAQQLAVSKVMAEAGIAIGSNYGLYATGAYTMTLHNVMERIFRFHPGMKEVRWKNYEGFNPVSANYTDEEWYAMIINEIDNSRPILYSATNYERAAGHSFVIDGYDNDNLFHINWGWGGGSNGFFALTALLPSDDYQSAYPDMHEMWIGLMPEEHRPGQTSKLYFHGLEDSGISHYSTSIESNVPVTIYLKGLQYRLPDLKGELGVALKNDNGETVEIAAQTTPLGMGSVIENATFHTSGIGADWQLQATYREEGGEWIEIPGCFGNDHCPTVQDGANITFDVEDGLDVSIHDIDGGIIFPDNNGKLLPGSYSVQLRIDDESCRYHLEVDGSEEANIHAVYQSAMYPIPIYAIVASIEIKPGSNHTIKAYSVHHSVLEHKEITVETPGTLQAKLTGNDLDRIGSLKINGNINLSDLIYICDNCPNLHTLDAFEANYERTGNYGWHSYKSALDKSLQTLLLPCNIAKIGYVDISYTSALKTLHIPSSVTTINTHAVQSEMLRDVYVYNPVPPTLEDLAETGDERIFIWNFPELITIHVPYGSKAAYEQTGWWNKYAQIVEFDPSSGVDNIIDNRSREISCDIFNAQGICLKSGASAADIDNLRPGIYLLRFAGSVRKIVKQH